MMRPLNEPPIGIPSTQRELPPIPSPARVQELLVEAARLGRDDMVPVLLEAGADIEGVDAKGHTALVLATYNGFETTAELLLKRGADPNGNTTSGSPLMGVSFKGYLPIARRLLDAGADPNLRNSAGQTAIMMSALFDRREIIELLLSSGADIDAVDAAGNDAASLARMQGNENLARWLAERSSGTHHHKAQSLAKNSHTGEISMSEVSIGPGSNEDQSTQERVDAQAETERDIDRAQAGAEAKPFANQPRTEDEDSKPAVSTSAEELNAADGAANLISGRRNAGRE